MKLHFYERKRGFIPRAIRYFTGGSFNHVSIEIGGAVYEAIGGRILGSNGVVMSPHYLSYHTGKVAPDNVVTVSIPISNLKGSHRETVDYLKKRVGAPYDYRGLFSFVLRFMKGKEHESYCSELARDALSLYTGKDYSEVKQSPSSLYELVK